MGRNGFWCPVLLLPHVHVTFITSAQLLLYPDMTTSIRRGFFCWILVLNYTWHDFCNSICPLFFLNTSVLLFLKVSPLSLSLLHVHLHSLKGLIMDSKLYPATTAHQKHRDMIRHLCTHWHDMMLKTGIRAQWVWKYLILVKKGMQKCKCYSALRFQHCLQWQYDAK